MPGGDRTGPMGMGPMTGRAAGYCAGSPTPGFASAPGGRGMGGRGFGGGGRGGRGRRNQFFATGLTGWQRAAGDATATDIPATGTEQSVTAPQSETTAAVSKEKEIEQLKRQAEGLANMLGEINRRIDGLESQEV